MFRAAGYRLMSWLGLVAFVAANTCGSLWHDHSPASHSAAHADHASHACQHGHAHTDHADHCHDHSHASSATTHKQAPDANHGLAVDQAGASHDDCVVCRFIGQRVLTVSAVTLGNLSEASQQLAVRQPAALSLDPTRTLHSRAPPALG